MYALNCQTGGRSENHDWFENDNPIDMEFMKRYNSSEPFWPSTESLESVAKGERIILMDRTYVLSKGVHNIFALPRNMFISSLQMISERGFPLLNRYSAAVSRMNDAGLMEKLYSDFRYNATYLQYIRTRGQDEKPTIVLKLRHLDGAFAILLIGSIVSVFVFFIENCADVHRRRERAHRRWQLIRNFWIVEKKKTRTLRNRRKRNRVFCLKKTPGLISNGIDVNAVGIVMARKGTYEYRYFE